MLVATPVPSRARVSCLHAERCPGCPAIGLPYPEQLAQKAERVRLALAGFASLAHLTVAPTRAADPIVRYRTRAKLVADRQGALGLYAHGSHDVVDLPECVVLEPLVFEVVAQVRALLRATRVLEGVDVVRVEGGVFVTLIAGPHTAEGELAAFAAALQNAEARVLSVAVSRRATDAVQLLGSDLHVLRGPETASRRLAPDMPAYAVAHGGFVQAHDATAEAILRRLVAELGRTTQLASARVLELYAGAGALSLWLAAQGANVTAVESFKPACERLTRAAEEQKLSVNVVADDAAHAMHELASKAVHFEAVVVNPPRRGLDRRVREALGVLAPGMLLYVSCDPATLARDLSHLASLGLCASQLVPFDMIPLTAHVESLALLTPGPAPSPVVLYEDDALLAVDKPPHVAIDEGPHALSLRVRARPGWERALPLLPLAAAESGVVLFARDASVCASLESALLLSTRKYHVLARGITHGGGRLTRPAALGSRYVRREVVGGHSLLEVAIDSAGPPMLARQLAALRHPVLGHEKHGDRRSNQHFNMRHGLDRAFVHCAELTFMASDRQHSVRAPLSADLALVLDSLRRSEA